MLKDDRESHSLHLKTVSRCHRKSLKICLKKDVPSLSLERIEIQATFFGGGRGEKEGQSAFVSKDYCFVAISAVYYFIDR